MENQVDKKKIISQYLTPGSASGFSSRTSFLKNSKFKNKEEVENVLSNLRTYSIHKPIRRTYKRRKVHVNFIDDTWTFDIGVMLKYKFSNSHFGYFLVVQDIFSKYIWTFPLKKKDCASLLDAFSKLFKKTKRRPKKLWGDKDKAWYNKEFLAMLEKYKIKLYSTFSTLKAVYAELAVKHIKAKLYKNMTQKNTKNWVNVLTQVTRSINNSYNSSIGMAPSSVKEEDESKIWYRIYKSVIDMDEPIAKYAVGQKVRIGKTKIELREGEKDLIQTGLTKFLLFSQF
jgi:L-rhamnose mutarotase